MTTTDWNVRTPEGRLVSDLRGLAAALRTDQPTAMKRLLAEPDLAAAAPTSLLIEIKGKARPKPGDGTPPPISTGNFVSWSNGKGRVDLLVRKGKVPGVKDSPEATSDSPAARVTVWKDGKATDEKIAMSTHRLKRIAPLDKPQSKGDPAAVLVQMVADYDAERETKRLPECTAVTGASVKSVYERGVRDWPGPSRTSLSPHEWGIGRVEHFMKVASLTVVETKHRDADLLTKGHPLAQGQSGGHPDTPEGRGQVTMSMEQVQADLARIQAALD